MGHTTYLTIVDEGVLLALMLTKKDMFQLHLSWTQRIASSSVTEHPLARSSIDIIARMLVILSHLLLQEV